MYGQGCELSPGIQHPGQTLLSGCQQSTRGVRESRLKPALRGGRCQGCGRVQRKGSNGRSQEGSLGWAEQMKWGAGVGRARRPECINRGQVAGRGRPRLGTATRAWGCQGHTAAVLLLWVSMDSGCCLKLQETWGAGSLQTQRGGEQQPLWEHSSL